jgi:hypothetical protein
MRRCSAPNRRGGRRHRRGRREGSRQQALEGHPRRAARPGGGRTDRPTSDVGLSSLQPNHRQNASSKFHPKIDDPPISDVPDSDKYRETPCNAYAWPFRSRSDTYAYLAEGFCTGLTRAPPGFLGYSRMRRKGLCHGNSTEVRRFSSQTIVRRPSSLRAIAVLPRLGRGAAWPRR